MSCPDPTPRVSGRHGAPLGRHTGATYLDVEAGRLYLRRIRLNSGGYDAGGAYWGLGTALWYVADQDGNGYFFRCPSREGAKVAVHNEWPGATFYR